MRNIAVICLLFSFFNYTFGGNIIQFKISKPYCILNFMETATNGRATSVTFRDFIEGKAKDDEAFKELCTRFSSIQLDYSVKRPEYPENRKQYLSSYDLLLIALVNSNNLDEFNSKATGYLPFAEQQKLMAVLKKAEAYYDRYVWKDYEQKAIAQKAALEEFASQSSDIFQTINQFYQSSWSADVPFIVSIYPIPGAKGHTTATPHVNSLCIGVLADETDHVGRMGVVLHEMCHVLYDEQTAEMQTQLAHYFDSSTSPYKAFANNFFDEGLATAIGNGWAYKSLNGQLDTTEWYSNEYINGFAHAMYPMVSDYIENKKSIDSVFITKAISLFGKQFPNALNDYGLLFNRVSIYSDGQTEQGNNNLMNELGKHFQLAYTSFSSPITHPFSIESLKENTDTQLIIVDSNHEENLKALKKLFPEVKKLKLHHDTIYSFRDVKNRPIVLVYAKDASQLPQLFSNMAKRKSIDTSRIEQN